jgi:O-antigen/teichoic acid export membrane protein
MWMSRDQFQSPMGTGLVKDVVATFAVQAAIMLGGFVLYGLIARLFGPVAVGEYTIIRRALYVLQPFILIGITVAVPRFLAMATEESQRGQIAVVGVTAVLACSFSVALLMAGISDWLAEVMFGRADARNLVCGLAALTVAFGFHSVVYSYYRGIRDMRSANRLDVTNLFAVPLVAVVLSLRSGMAAMVAITALLTIIATTILASTLWRMVGSSLRAGRPKAALTRTLFAYGLPRIPGDLALAGLLFGGAYVVAREVGLEAAGYFGVAQTLLMLPGTALAAFAVILLPYVSERLAADDIAAVQSSSALLFNALVDLGVYFALHVAIFADVILKLWLGADMLGAAPLVSVLMFSVPFYAVYFVFRSVLDAAAHRPLTTINLLLAFLTCVVLYALLAFAGLDRAFAAAWALGGSFVVLGSLTMAGVVRLLKVHRLITRGTMTMFAANLLIAGLAYGARHVGVGDSTLIWITVEALCMSTLAAVLLIRRRDWLVALRARASEARRRSPAGALP